MNSISTPRLASIGHKCGRPPSPRCVLYVLLGMLLASVPVSVFSGDTGMTSAPGFRPDGGREQDQAFVNSFASSSVTILPTVLRTVDGFLHDPGSAALLGETLQTERLAARTEVVETALVPGELPGGGPQFDLFKHELKSLETSVAELKVKTEYVLMVEVLLTPRRRGGEAVGGIHCFLLTRDGRNAFSFLLNSHHRTFADAALRTETVGGDGRAELVARATRLAGKALKQQLALVK